MDIAQFLFLVFVGLPGAVLVLTTLLSIKFLVLARMLCHAKRTQTRRLGADNTTYRDIATVGFFHPYCNAGGGGERVLWMMISALQRRYETLQCIIYTGDQDASSEQILQKAYERFQINVDRSKVKFVFLKRRRSVEASSWPHFTLLGQSLGSIWLGFEALCAFVPDIYIDSMGYAFTIPLFRYIGGCKTAVYVHYPTISTDMLKVVSDRTEAFNNPAFVSRSPLLSFCKLIYYKVFAIIYGFAGRRCDLVMVNGSWTRDHVSTIWRIPERTHIVYPPCNTAKFEELDLRRDRSLESFVISLGQFRPEKNHLLQLDAFSQFLKLCAEQLTAGDHGLPCSCKLIIAGSCRNVEDEQRVQVLRNRCQELEIADSIEFALNLPFTRILQLLQRALVGLHTMRNEHFGIGVVEMMSAGCVVLAHDSGGPKMDIISVGDDDGDDAAQKRTGFLAQDADSFAEALLDIFKLSDRELLELQKRARSAAQRFSDDRFVTCTLTLLDPLLKDL